MRDPVESYFTQLRDIYASGAGVAETSYYGPLATLLTDLGHKLKPKVSAIINLRNTGAGIPDGGLFTATQLKGWDPSTDPLHGQKPARGAIEVKGTSDDVLAIAASDQVARYVDHYDLVLVTNLRDFVLVGRGPDGTGVRTLESCKLSSSEAAFWARVQQPRKFAQDAGEGLTQFLRRVLLHNAELSDPKDVAWFLASYARTARLRLEQRHDLDALAQLRNQLEESLGLKFEGEKGDHFFRSTLVQTLFYGMFASWVLWARDKDRAEVIPWERRFQWETASQTLHVPMVAELFYQFSNPRGLRDLHIDEVLEWAEEILWRINRTSFFEKFQEEHAVQYFYEPFLEAFDPQLRKELGVWYTPDEVVKYMVARVDWALREELGIADGLADPSVVVLDPCCGTGAYLVEVLRKIDETLQAKGADALTRQDVRRAAMERIIGFEIMPAPFVVAHLQMGILLAELGVPLKDADERAAIYLTNALTGWGDGSAEPPKDKRVHPNQMHSTLLFPEFAHERDAADRVKREEKILVIIGNPPYNSFAGVAQAEEAELVAPYKAGLFTEWGVKKFNLDDLYVRFVRLAERQVTEGTGRGVVCFITNFSFTSEISFAVMRRRLASQFDDIWIDNLNGDSRETGKRTPSGSPDPSVFSTSKNREGIRVGTAVATFVKRGHDSAAHATVMYRDFWGASKRADLLAETVQHSLPYLPVPTSKQNAYSFRPSSVRQEYLEWPTVRELAGANPLNGPVERRGNALISIDRQPLVDRLRAYFNPTVDDAQVEALHPSLLMTGNRIVGPEARKRLVASHVFDETKVVSYVFKPFDVRWCYLDNIRPLFSEPSPQLIAQQGDGAAFFVTRDAADKVDEGVPFIWSSVVCDYHALDGEARHFPVTLGPDSEGLFAHAASRTPNASSSAVGYLAHLGETDSSGLWMHALAVGYSPMYLTENRDGVRADWPRIPLPDKRDAFCASRRIGSQVAMLLDPTTAFNGSLVIGVLASSSGAALDPTADLGLTARWGIAGRGGITMPSTGRLTERPYTDDERTAIAEAAEPLGMSSADAVELLGETCFDVWLNDVAYWRCVPANVWRYTIGGYQVIKKWLSYRERALLGRDLKPEEARYVTEMVRRIAALVLMGPELDANYERVKADVWEWGV